MADAGALWRPAVAGHARAVVKHVRHVELHIYVVDAQRVLPGRISLVRKEKSTIGFAAVL